MKLKKFNQFIKENSEMGDDIIPEESDLALENEMENEFDDIDEFTGALGDSKGEENDGYSEEDEDNYSKYEEDDDELEYKNQSDMDFEGEEEEGHEYQGSVLMRELADKLGVEVINNKIEYNGQEINYYSETEKFHIGKSKFDTIEEVLDFVGQSDVVSDIEPMSPSMLEEPELVDESSRRFIKRF